MVFIIYTKEFPQKRKKKNTQPARPTDAPAGPKNPDSLSVFSASWILAPNVVAIIPTAELTLQSDLANKHQKLQQSMEETRMERRQKKKFCLMKRVSDQKKVSCCREKVDFFPSIAPRVRNNMIYLK